jgi:hypothetical protein
MSERGIETTLVTRLPLLARMRRDLLDRGALRPTTVVAMYAPTACTPPPQPRPYAPGGYRCPSRGVLLG